MKTELKKMKKDLNDHCNSAVKAANEAKATLSDTVTLDDIASVYRKMTDVINRR